MTTKCDIDNMRDTLRWAIAIMVTLLLVLVGSGVRAELRTNSNKDQIEIIRKDYLPSFAFEYIVQSNNKLMNIILSIDSKDDIRYQKAIKEWSDLQQEVIKQAGLNKTRSLNQLH